MRNKYVILKQKDCRKMGSRNSSKRIYRNPTEPFLFGFRSVVIERIEIKIFEVDDS